MAAAVLNLLLKDCRDMSPILGVLGGGASEDGGVANGIDWVSSSIIPVSGCRVASAL